MGPLQQFGESPDKDSLKEAAASLHQRRSPMGLLLGPNCFWGCFWAQEDCCWGFGTGFVFWDCLQFSLLFVSAFVCLVLSHLALPCLVLSCLVCLFVYAFVSVLLFCFLVCLSVFVCICYYLLCLFLFYLRCAMWYCVEILCPSHSTL